MKDKRQLIRLKDPSEIPEGMSREEAQRFWDNHEITEEFLEKAGSVPDEELPPTRPRTKPIAIRFDGDSLERLKALAKSKHKGYQTLVKEFVAERLYEEERRERIVDSMETFRKPERKAHRKYLFLDAAQVAASLSAFEGGAIEEVRSKSTEESGGGKGLTGEVGVSGLKVGGNWSKNQKMNYEEDVLRQRTGYSRISTLLERLHDENAIGLIESYTPEVYEQIEEDELYEFKAEIRMHPLHQFASMARGWAEAGENFGWDAKHLTKIADEIERAFYGRDKNKKAFSIFAELEGSSPEYKVAMPIKEDHLVVDLEEFSGKATFVAQIDSKISAGRKVPAARLVRNTPTVSPVEKKMMLQMLPALEKVPGLEELGIHMGEDDILLRKPAMTMKPLCIYKG